MQQAGDGEMRGAGVLAVWALAFVVAAPFVPLGLASATSAPIRASPPPPDPHGMSAGAVFVRNEGQIGNTDVRFYLDAGPTEFGFADRSVLIRIVRAGREVLARATFDGGNRVVPEGTEPASQRNHYFLGSDPARWRQDVATFHSLVYENLYPGIDLRYRLADGGVKYAFEVAPGADPGQIQIAYEGIAGLALTTSGDLVMHTTAGDVRDTAPVAIQPDAAIACSFALRGPRSVGFDCRGWDPARPFTIDPLLFVTYLGGSDADEARAVAVDGGGNVYVTGQARSSDFPTTPGAFNRTNRGSSDAFVAKFNAGGTALVYATFLGGVAIDTGFAIAVDASGSAFVAGRTFSADFPTTAGALSRSLAGGADGFIAKLSPSGSALSYATYLGGSGGGDSISSIALDASGDAFVTGTTGLNRTGGPGDFPTTPGAYQRTYGGSFLDAFVAEVDAAGSALVFSTFLGGNQVEQATSVARDLSGNVYVTGLTASTDFPTTPGAFSTLLNGTSDAFVAKLAGDGSSLLYSTFLGGSSQESGAALAVDAGGRAFVGGITVSTNFPTTLGAWDRTCGTDGNCNFDGSQPYDDGFVTEVDATGAALVYSTYLGGSSHDDLTALAIDGSGRAIVAGYTRSTDFPVTPGADNTTFLGGLDDGFVTKLNATGTGLVYSTFLGGGSSDEIFGLALDGAGVAHVAGLTDSSDLPTTPGAYDRTCGTDGNCNFDGVQRYDDAFVAKVALAFPLTLATIPPGLQLFVDGSPVTAPSVYLCDPGTTPSVQAPASQVAFSTRFAFRSWSDGGAATHFVVCAGPATLTATYDPTEYQITVATAPSGLQILFDGGPQTAPYRLPCGVSSSHTINVSSPQVVGTTRYVFLSWSDAGSQAHGIVCNGPTTYTATYATEFQVIVTAVPPACQIVVDGIPYAPPVQFWWPDGSSHLLDVPSPQGSNSTRYVFRSWSDGGAQAHAVTIRAAQTYSALCTTQHHVTVLTVPAGLLVSVNATTMPAPDVFWCDAGTNLTLDAPSPQVSGRTQYLFSNWSDGGAKAHAVTCASPTIFTARFSTQHETNLATIPLGLVLLVNGANHSAPYTFWCTEGTSNTLEAPSPQGSGGTRHTFQSWSDGGARQHAVACAQPSNYTAVFDTEHLVTIATSPAGLLVTVDGATTAAPVSNWWVEGSTHLVNVSSPQTTGDTRAVLVRWSDGGTQSHSVQVLGPLSVTATFRIEHRVTLDTLPIPLNVTLNGTEYTAGYPFWLAEGSSWTVGVASPQNGTPGVRYVWGPTSGWSDGGTQVHGITINGPMTLVATLETQYLLSVQSAHGSPWCDHNATGCWYTSGETATFLIDTIVYGGLDTEFVFQGWTGDLNLDKFHPIGAILMTEPKTESARWLTQYYLHVIAQPGTATGDGWYDAGAEGAFAVNATEITGSDGKRLRFAGWSYDFNGTAAGGTLLMDAPKTVIAHWVEVPFLETAWVLFVLPAIAAVLILVFLIWRRRRKKKETDEYGGTEDVPTEPDEPAASSQLEEELDLHASA